MRCGNVNDDAVDYFDLKCAWCKRVIGGSNVKDSHGMCEACYLRQLQIRRAPGERPAHPTHGDGIEPAQE